MKKQTTLKAKTLGRPKSTLKDNLTVPAAERNTKVGEMRKTYLVNIELSKQIDKIAYVDRTTVKNVVLEAFTNHVMDWEKKNGPLIISKTK